MVENDNLTEKVSKAFITASSQIDFSKIHKDQSEIIDLTLMFKGEKIPEFTKEEVKFIIAVFKTQLTITIKAIISLKRDGVL